MRAHFQIIAIQTGQKVVTLTKIDHLTSTDYKPDMAMKGVFVSQNNLCCWDGHKIAVYENVDSGTGALIGELRGFRTLVSDVIQALLGSFACTSQVVVLYGQSLYAAEPGRVQVRTFQVRS